MSIKKCWYITHFINGNHSSTHSMLRTKGEVLQHLNLSTKQHLGTTLSDIHIKKLFMTTGGFVSVQDEDGAIHTWVVDQLEYNANV